MSKWEMPESGSFRYLNPMCRKELLSTWGEAPPGDSRKIVILLGMKTFVLIMIYKIMILREIFCPKMERAADFAAARSISQELYYHKNTLGVKQRKRSTGEFS